MTKVSKDMIIADIIQIDSGIAQFFVKAGLGCAGCPAAKAETLEEAGTGHGVDVDALVEEINQYLEAQGA